MANIQSNPWSFTSADPATAAITAATGLTLNADGTVTITTTGALTFNTSGVVIPVQWFTVIGATNPVYNGFYKLIIGVSGGTTFTMAPQFAIPAGTAQSGSGTLIQCLYPWQVRMEDLSWEGLAGVGATGSLDLRDRSGNIIWQAAILSNTAGTGYQNRGKLFWVNGFSPNVIAATTVVLITID